MEEIDRPVIVLERIPIFIKGQRGRPRNPIAECTEKDGHDWRSKGTDSAGARLVKCSHCKRSTTASNAGVDPGPVRHHPATPVTIVAPCSDPRGHAWQRTPGEQSSVTCIHCDAESLFVRRVRGTRQ